MRKRGPERAVPTVSEATSERALARGAGTRRLGVRAPAGARGGGGRRARGCGRGAVRGAPEPRSPAGAARARPWSSPISARARCSQRQLARGLGDLLVQVVRRARAQPAAPRAEADPLWLGSIVHDALEQLYREPPGADSIPRPGDSTPGSAASASCSSGRRRSAGGPLNHAPAHGARARRGPGRRLSRRRGRNRDRVPPARGPARARLRALRRGRRRGARARGAAPRRGHPARADRPDRRRPRRAGRGPRLQDRQERVRRGEVRRGGQAPDPALHARRRAHPRPRPRRRPLPPARRGRRAQAARAGRARATTSSRASGSSAPTGDPRRTSTRALDEAEELAASAAREMRAGRHPPATRSAAGARSTAPSRRSAGSSARSGVDEDNGG